MHEKTERYIIHFPDIPAERQRMPELAAAQRTNNFTEVELGFTREAAQQEARRCLSCRRCLGCALCLAVCKPKAIVFEQQDEIIDLLVDEVIISPAAGQTMPLKKGELGYGEYTNVVSALAFERILSDSGPYDGLVLRPHDGRIPEKIAFIVTAGSGNNDQAAYAMQEAALAVKKVPDLAVTIFLPENENIQKPSSPQITIKQASIAGVKEIEETKNLLITFEQKSAGAEETFDMLIIAGPLEPSPEIKELYKKIGT